MIIRSLQINDSRSVAELHIRNLQTSFTGWSGLQLLTLYYKAITRGIGGCGFISEENGYITGYICGIWDPNALNRVLISNFFVQLIFWSAIQVLDHPSQFFSMIRRMNQREDKKINLEGYELRPIVVSPEARGSGVAMKLVKRLLEDAAQKSYAKIFLITEKDNIAAQNLYQKMGFIEVGKFSRLETIYIQYERSLDT
jgi:ribosomal protein S18 acetylase RimI-like enzyme